MNDLEFWLMGKIEGSSADGFLSLEKEIQRSYIDEYESETLDLGEKDLEMLGRYLRRMLVVDPEQRARSEDLLAEPWVSEAIRTSDEEDS